MLKKLSTIGYTAALATSPAWLTACTTPTEPAATPENPEVLFSVSSDGVHFENAKGNEVTLVMENVDPYTVWFADRPTRESGAFTTEQLVSDWNEDSPFASDPPNAALVLHEPMKDQEGNVTDTLVATVNDASYDPKAKELRANLTVLSEEEASKLTGPLQNHGDRQDIGWPTEAGSASLFIDPIVLCSNPQTCNSSSTVNYTYNSTIYFTTTIVNSVP